MAACTSGYKKAKNNEAHHRHHGRGRRHRHQRPGRPVGGATITHAAAQHLMVRGLIERDRGATQYTLTEQGRAVLAALLAGR
jgi:hypothetical protein